MVTDKSKPRRKQFEYEFFEKIPNNTQEFNKLGQKGWEIIHFYKSKETVDILCKREIIDEND